MKINAKKWSHELQSGRMLRKAIQSGDMASVLKALLSCYEELRDAEIIDEYDFERYTEDFELYLYDDFDEDSWDDPEELVDYELGEFYDLCDNLNVWIPID